MVTTQTVINSDSRQSMRTQHTHTAMHLKHTAWTLIILLLAFTAPHSVVGDGSDVNSNRALQQACGGLGQKCCLRCPEGTSSDGKYPLQPVEHGRLSNFQHTGTVVSLLIVVVNRYDHQVKQRWLSPVC